MKFKFFAGALAAALMTAVTTGLAQAKTVHLSSRACGGGAVAAPCVLRVPVSETIYGTTSSTSQGGSGIQLWAFSAKKGQRYSIKVAYTGHRPLKTGHQAVLMVLMLNEKTPFNRGLILCAGPSDRTLRHCNTLVEVDGSGITPMPLGQPLSGQFPANGVYEIGIVGANPATISFKNPSVLGVAVPYRLDLKIG